MSDDSQNDLQRFLAEEPFVRSLAKQLVVEDADEVVQQTYLRALENGGRGVSQPRNWLGRIVRNVANNLRRGDRRRSDHERHAAVQAMVPSAADLVEREERRRALVLAVNRLSPTLRTVVLLRWFEGMPPRDIAALLEIPVATVSTQLQRAYERLRHVLDAEHDGQRRAWLLPLVPLAARPPLPVPPLIPALPVLTSGAILMTIKSKVMLAAAVIVAFGAWMLAAGDVAPPTAPPVAAGGEQVDPARAGDAGQPESVAGVVKPLQREAVAAQIAGQTGAATGSVLVHLRYHDQSPAAGRMMSLRALGTDARFAGLRHRTDAAGSVRYDDVPPGTMFVSPVNHHGKRVEIVAGEVAEVAIELSRGMTLQGKVVDTAKRPIAGALVETTMMAMSDAFPLAMAVSGSDGRFTIRAAHKWCLVGARAEGYCACNVQLFLGQDGDTTECELVLGDDGGSVAGVVVDAAGEPVRNAVVIVGDGELSGIAGQEHMPPFAALSRTDADGKFFATGIAAGKQRVRSRMPGFALWTGECEVKPGEVEQIRITLSVGASVRGVVYDEHGGAVNGVDVRVGNWSDLGFVRARSADDGSFLMTGLPAGEVTIKADQDKLGRAQATITTEAGQTSIAALHLSLGFQLRGRVVDVDGNPVPNVRCECMADTSTEPWFERVKTDAQGLFVAANCPEEGLVTIRVSGSGFERLLRHGIDPKAGVVQLQLQRSAPKSVRMTLTVLTADGLPAKNATAYAARPTGGGTDGMETTDKHGHAELGPYPPGPWKVYVQHRDHPFFISEPRDLAENETWDLGTVTLLRGGTAVVARRGELDVDAQAEAEFVAMDLQLRHAASFSEGVSEPRSSMMAPGNYLLFARGPGIAAQAVPFTIRAGESTTVNVELQKGVEQAFTIVLPAGESKNGLALKVMRGDVVVARVWASLGDDGRLAGSSCLLPGDYTISASIGQPAGKTAFVVGTVPGAPLEIALR